MKNPTNAPAETVNGPESIKAEASLGQAAVGKRQKKPPKKITETYLYNSGLYYLQRYAASSTRFRAVMARRIDRSCRAHPDQDRAECSRLLEKIVSKFQELGYLNDDSYARMKISSLLGRGLSRRMAMVKMQHAGIPEAQIAAALESYNLENQTTAEETEMAAALKLARKKRVGPFAQGQPYDRNKAMAAFARAGFSFEIIKQVLALAADNDFQESV